MKLQVRKYPIYVLSIDSGDIDTFTKEQEAVKFFLSKEESGEETKEVGSVVSALPLNKSNRNNSSTSLDGAVLCSSLIEQEEEKKALQG